MIITAHSKRQLISAIEQQQFKYPVTVDITQGRKRSVEQNQLQRLWLNEAAEQLKDESAEDKRAYCKLHFGVPILRNENKEFKRQYDKVIRPLSYEDKLEIMKVPFDCPVTRLMKTGQKKRYLDDMWHFFTNLGVRLTDPDEAKYGGW